MAYNVKFLKGTASSYASLGTKDVNTFYYIDGKDLYLGNIKLSSQVQLEEAITNIATNAEEIGKIKTALSSFTKTDFDNLVTRVSTIEGTVGTLSTDVSDLKTSVGDHGTRLTAVEGVADKNKTDLATLTGTVADLAQNSATKTELNTTNANVKANADAIAVLNGDGVGSVSAAVAAGIAEVVAEAPESFDTLKEVADWIANDTTGAAAMQADVAQLKKDVADHETRLGTAEDAIETLQDEMDAVEELAGQNKAAHEKNAGDIATANENIAKNVEDIGKANAAISAEVKRATEAEAGLSGRIASLEEMTTGGTGSIAQQIEAAKTEAINTAKGYTDTEIGLSEAELRGEIKSAKEEAISTAASSAAELYATKAQGALADTALQASDIASGTAQGSIKVKGSDIAVTGLGSAAFTEASAYDVNGAAAAAQTAATQAAKDYADSLAGNYDVKGSAATAESNAKIYVDQALTWGELA